MSTTPATARIGFRPLQLSDLPNLQRWLADPDVAPWYRSDSLTLPALTARYTDRITGRDSTRAAIIQIDQQPVGYIQCYWIADEPEYARQLDLPPAPPPGTVGTDLFIGEATFRNHGWGAPILRAFHDQVVFGTMRASRAIIAPAPENTRAIRVYERVGFRWLKTVPIVVDESPENTGDEYVMTMDPHTFYATKPFC